MSITDNNSTSPETCQTVNPYSAPFGIYNNQSSFIFLCFLINYPDNWQYISIELAAHNCWVVKGDAEFQNQPIWENFDISQL